MPKRPRNQRQRSAHPRPAAPASAANASTDLLVARIGNGNGELDGQLPALIDAINQRARTLSDLQLRDSLAQLSVGARVRINSTVSPRYLQGQCGEVHDIDGDHVVVCLDTPTGRFTSGHIRCAPLSPGAHRRNGDVNPYLSTWPRKAGTGTIKDTLKERVKHVWECSGTRAKQRGRVASSDLCICFGNSEAVRQYISCSRSRVSS
jgi:hypothetical protein